MTKDLHGKVKLNQNINFYNAKIFDFSGRLLKEVNFTHKVNINDIDNKGIKILTIESNEKKITKKFNIK